MHVAHTGPHLTDADLIRHVDEEGDTAEIGRRAAHLGECPLCAGRVRRLDHQSGTVRAWLLRSDSAPRPASLPRRRRTAVVGPWLRAAAIVLLIAAPLAALPPVRQWVAERVGLADETGGAAELAQAAAPAAASVIRFTPAPGTFTIHVDAAAPGSMLVLARAAGPEAVLRGALEGGPAPVVSDDALRIPASATRGGAYELRLPSAVEAVLVLVDGRTTRVRADEIDAGRTVPLSVNR